MILNKGGLYHLLSAPSHDRRCSALYAALFRDLAEMAHVRIYAQQEAFYARHPHVFCDAACRDEGLQTPW